MPLLDNERRFIGLEVYYNSPLGISYDSPLYYILNFQALTITL